LIPVIAIRCEMMGISFDVTLCRNIL